MSEVRKLAERRSPGNPIPSGSGIAAILLAVLLGAAVAVLPPSVTLRASALLLLILGGGLAWAFRSERFGLPGRGLLIISQLTIASSILWPKYIVFGAGSIGLTPQNISLAACLCLILFWIVLSPQLCRKIAELHLFSGGVLALLVAWISWRLVTSIAGDYPLESSIQVIRETIYHLGLALVGVIVLTYPQGDIKLSRILIGCLLISAAYGILESVSAKNPLVKYASAASNDAAAEAVRSILVEKFRGGKYRAQSFFTHPIVFSQFVAGILPLCLYLFASEKSRLWRLLSAISLPLGIVAIGLSGSRSGWVGIIFSFSLIVFTAWLRAIFGNWRSRMISLVMLPAFISFAGLSVLGAQSLLEGKTRTEQGSTDARQTMVHLGVQALKSSPIFGFGDGAAIGKAGLSDSSGHASIDSYLLTAALDSGYIGLFLFVSIYIAVCYAAFRPSIDPKNMDAAQLSMTWAAASAVFVSFFGLSIPHNMGIMWILVALCVSISGRSLHQSKTFHWESTYPKVR